jgi:hypothetical protein
MVNDSGGFGRVEFRADDPAMTPHAGLELSGELARRLRLVERIDEAIVGVGWPGPVKVRDRGLHAGELVVSVAESIMCGAECWDDLEDLRADVASRPLRAVAAAPASSTARQRAALYRRSHLQAVERAVADAAARLDAHNGMDHTGPQTIDLDGTDLQVYAVKQGAARGRGGMMGYTPHIATWAERRRALTCELYGANHTLITGKQALKIARRAAGLLPDGHGQVTFRVDAGYASAELMMGLRAIGARFTMSLRRTPAMWRTLDRIAEDDWQDALSMPGAQVAELEHVPTGWKHEPLRLIVRRVACSAADLLATSTQARRRRTVPRAQIALALAGEASTVYAYSFVLTDRRESLAEVELFHRRRAQIEERIREAKIGQAMRHMPCRNVHQNRFWLACCLLALNTTSMLADMTPPAPTRSGPDGRQRCESPHDRVRADEKVPRHRTIKTVRRWILNVPGRIVRTGRRTAIRLPAGHRHLATITTTYGAILAIPP